MIPFILYHVFGDVLIRLPYLVFYILTVFRFPSLNLLDF